MILDRRTAQADLVVELPRGQNVLTGEPVVTVDPPRLPQADLRGQRHQAGISVTGFPRHNRFHLVTGSIVVPVGEVLLKVDSALEYGRFLQLDHLAFQSNP